MAWTQLFPGNDILGMSGSCNSVVGALCCMYPECESLLHFLIYKAIDKGLLGDELNILKLT